MRPLRFKPLLKETLWGGNKIVAFKQIDSDLQQVGESWEISGVPGNETIVSGGKYDGQPLSDLILTCPRRESPLIRIEETRA